MSAAEEAMGRAKDIAARLSGAAVPENVATAAAGSGTGNGSSTDGWGVSSGERTNRKTHLGEHECIQAGCSLCLSHSTSDRTAKQGQD